VKIGLPSAARPIAHGNAITITKRFAALICVLTLSISSAANEAVSVGTEEAAIAEAIEIGTLIKSLYLPVNTPHQRSI
jgi:hypothetical protein